MLTHGRKNPGCAHCIGESPYPVKEVIIGYQAGFYAKGTLYLDDIFRRHKSRAPMNVSPGLDTQQIRSCIVSPSETDHIALNGPRARKDRSLGIDVLTRRKEVTCVGMCDHH